MQPKREVDGGGKSHRCCMTQQSERKMIPFLKGETIFHGNKTLWRWYCYHPLPPKGTIFPIYNVDENKIENQHHQKNNGQKGIRVVAIVKFILSVIGLE